MGAACAYSSQARGGATPSASACCACTHVQVCACVTSSAAHSCALSAARACAWLYTMRSVWVVYQFMDDGRLDRERTVLGLRMLPTISEQKYALQCLTTHVHKCVLCMYGDLLIFIFCMFLSFSPVFCPPPARKCACVRAWARTRMGVDMHVRACACPCACPPWTVEVAVHTHKHDCVRVGCVDVCTCLGSACCCCRP